MATTPSPLIYNVFHERPLWLIEARRYASKSKIHNKNSGRCNHIYLWCNLRIIWTDFWRRKQLKRKRDDHENWHFEHYRQKRLSFDSLLLLTGTLVRSGWQLIFWNFFWFNFFGGTKRLIFFFLAWKFVSEIYNFKTLKIDFCPKSRFTSCFEP